MRRKDPDKDLFDHAEARAARDDGMRRAEANAIPGFGEAAFDLITELCETREYFTPDAFWELRKERGAPDTPNRRALGPVMIKAVKVGLCKKAELPFVKCARKSRHSSPIQVWQSLIWRHDGR